MTTSSGKSCLFGLLCEPFVNVFQMPDACGFLSTLVFRVGCDI